jgi:DNA-binding FrmR family transcriptional regulator
MAHTKTNKAELIARVRRIAGQMAGIERAIADEAGCSAILHQVAGARGAINGLMDELVQDHIREHVAKPDLGDAERAAGAEELIAVMRRYSR